jgi:osmoprotectant transport system ATP-binding protein
MRPGKVVQYDTPLRILSTPADDFVTELTGAGDVLRRLSLLDVGSAMLPANGASPTLALGAAATLHPRESLRDALGQLLSSGAEALPVVDERGSHVGTIDMAAIRRLTHPE